jgi:hypothetical protein
MLVSGRPVTTEFYALSANKLVATVAAPGGVSEISFFLMPGYELPPGKGLIIFVSTAPERGEWETLGALHGGKPSATFVTRWSANPAISSAPAVTIGVGVEEADAVSNVVALEDQAAWDKLGFAQLVARDLFTHLGSYATMVPGLGERLVIPPSALALWLTKFEERFRRQGPNFLSRYSGT